MAALVLPKSQFAVGDGGFDFGKLGGAHIVFALTKATKQV